jgi:hypothetical protein
MFSHGSQKQEKVPFLDFQAFVVVWEPFCISIFNMKRWEMWFLRKPTRGVMARRQQELVNE